MKRISVFFIVVVIGVNVFSHSTSITHLRIYLSEKHLFVKINISADDLFQMHHLVPEKNGNIKGEVLKEAAQKHRELLAKKINIWADTVKLTCDRMRWDSISFGQEFPLRNLPHQVLEYDALYSGVDMMTAVDLVIQNLLGYGSEYAEESSLEVQVFRQGIPLLNKKKHIDSGQKGELKINDK